MYYTLGFTCLLLLLLLAGGCSSSSDSPGKPRAYGDTGTFIGDWDLVGFVDSNNKDWGLLATYPCTTKVTRADTLLICEITNDSTHEVLWVKGHLDGGYPDFRYPGYVVQDSSSLPIADSGQYVSFNESFPTVFTYRAVRLLPGRPVIDVFGNPN